ncbi:hypothetical protein GCM10009828_058840 [Actinoplanes couchii]|uniref:Uncharacterized protein n=1 Tax=Actinoplanes couchii TaxID=403638 RepID=A0ABQ3XTN8_9ACTN|nr:hypothetical protein Aco03nite_102680 [Actinoplanes couchii]
MISVTEFARRLSTLVPMTMSRYDIEDLADNAGVRIDPARGIDTDQAQRMLDHLTPPAPVSGVTIAASVWPPPEAVRPAVTPVTFSSLGAVGAPSEQPARPRSPRQGRGGKPGWSRPAR